MRNIFVFDSLDPTGTMIKYEARGIGPAEESIQDTLKEQYKEVRR
jgi:20S proteasome alpha/beta subunit